MRYFQYTLFYITLWVHVYILIFICRLGRDRKIEVVIKNYSNPELKADVMAEVMSFKQELGDVDISSTPKRKRPRDENTYSSETTPKKYCRTGKENEMQGALALMELSRNSSEGSP